MRKVEQKPMPNPEKAFEERARENRRKFLAPYEARVGEIIKRNKKKIGDIDAKAAKRSNRSLTSEESNVKRKIEWDTKKEIAEIIIELIKREPSHLAEEWILWTVIDWLRNSDDKDLLQAAFVDETGRNRRTKLQQERFVKDFFFMEAVNKISREEKTSIAGACQILAERQKGHFSLDEYYEEGSGKSPIYPTWKDGQDLAEKMRKKYYLADHNAYLKGTKVQDAEWREMQYPYWGRDVMP